MRAYRDSLSRCIWMALLVVLLLFPVLAIDPLELNSPVGLTTPVSADDGTGWSGTWNSPLGDLTTTQNGNQLTGDYTRDKGKIAGTVSGNQFTGTWSRAPSYKPPSDAGDLEFILAPDGKWLAGRWRPGTSASGSWLGPWEVWTWTRTGATTGTGWDGMWNDVGGGASIMAFTQSGNQLTIVFVTGGWKNRTGGTVSGNKFTAVWNGLDYYTNWDLTLAPDGQSITGTIDTPNDAMAPLHPTIARWWPTRTGTTTTGTPPGTTTGTPSGTPSGTTPGTTPGSTTSTGAALVAESRTAAPNSTVQVPIRLDKAGNIGSMNFMLTYNAQVLKVNKVDGGSLLSGALFTPNYKTPPQVRFGLATSQGISGSGTVAYIEFQVIGAAGSSSPLTFSELSTTDTSGKSVALTTQNGTVTVASAGGAGGKMKGDYNGDGKATELDALAALKMSVKLLSEDLTLDMDGNGKVTAEDARLILKKALGK